VSVTATNQTSAFNQASILLRHTLRRRDNIIVTICNRNKWSLWTYGGCFELGTKIELHWWIPECRILSHINTKILIYIFTYTKGWLAWDLKAMFGYKVFLKTYHKCQQILDLGKYMGKNPLKIIQVLKCFPLRYDLRGITQNTHRYLRSLRPLNTPFCSLVMWLLLSNLQTETQT
jgi:hypothetical protein